MNLDRAAWCDEHVPVVTTQQFRFVNYSARTSRHVGCDVVLAQLMSSIDPDVAQRLVQRCHRHRFGSGAFIFHAGEAGDTVHVIQSGRVAILAVTPLGDTLTLMILGAGDVFGELCLLGADHRRSATAQAIDTTETFVLARHDFDDLRRSDPDVDRFLIGLLTTQVTRLTQRLVETSALSAGERVYRRLVELGVTFGVADTGGAIPVTQEQLASMAGSSQRATNGVLAKAKRDGVIDLSAPKDHCGELGRSASPSPAATGVDHRASGATQCQPASPPDRRTGRRQRTRFQDNRVGSSQWGRAPGASTHRRHVDVRSRTGRLDPSSS